jgi:hypothetical protein
MLKKNTKRRKQLVDGIAAVVVIHDVAEFCFARLCGENVEKNYVGKLWNAITWEKCGKFVKRIV